MSDFNSSIRGAVDLSALANKVVKEKIDGPQADKTIKVPSLVVELNEAIARSVLQISNLVPVIVVFFDKNNQDSVALSQKLEKLVIQSNGTWFLAKVDVIKEPGLTEAFGVAVPATVAMILSGEPRPLFQGDQSEEDLQTFLDRLIQLAKDQGLTGKLEIGEETEEPEAQLSPAEQEALDAMEKGDFAAAVEIYEKELAKAPGNEMLIERLAQVRLLSRTYDGEIEKELQVIPTTTEEAMRKANFHMAIGDAEGAFTLLLEYFDKTQDKSQITNHLLELFNVAGKNHPAVIQARKLLAVKMF